MVASVIYGGSFNAFDEDKHKLLYAENAWIEGCLKRDIRYLESARVPSHAHVPDGAELLASSGLFGQQAMKYGNSTFAFQFHAEVTPTGFRRWQARHTENFE